MSRIAVAISGIEVVKTAMNETVRSRFPPSFIPAMTPRTSDSGIIRAKTQKARMPVFFNRSQSNGPTSVFFSNEWPKSPVSTPPTQFV